VGSGREGGTGMEWRCSHLWLRCSVWFLFIGIIKACVRVGFLARKALGSGLVFGCGFSCSCKGGKGRRVNGGGV
jgi:hypothetical protein